MHLEKEDRKRKNRCVYVKMSYYSLVLVNLNDTKKFLLNTNFIDQVDIEFIVNIYIFLFELKYLCLVMYMYNIENRITEIRKWCS